MICIRVTPREFGACLLVSILVVGVAVPGAGLAEELFCGCPSGEASQFPWTDNLAAASLAYSPSRYITASGRAYDLDMDLYEFRDLVNQAMLESEFSAVSFSVGVMDAFVATESHGASVRRVAKGVVEAIGLTLGLTNAELAGCTSISPTGLAGWVDSSLSDEPAVPIWNASFQIGQCRSALLGPLEDAILRNQLVITNDHSLYWKDNLLSIKSRKSDPSIWPPPQLTAGVGPTTANIPALYLPVPDFSLDLTSVNQSDWGDLDAHDVLCAGRNEDAQQSSFKIPLATGTLAVIEGFLAGKRSTGGAFLAPTR